MTTPELLRLAVLSHRIYAVVLRILQNRLVAAAELDSHSLLLECYHPSAKLTEPPYFCTYQGTEGLSVYKNPPESDPNVAARLGEMRNMYSRFRPYRRELESNGRRVKRPGDIPGSRTYPGTASDKFQGEVVKQTLSLEGHELFSQLMAQTHLSKIGPYNGLFTSFVEVEEGVLRVWREWLKDAAAKYDDADSKQEHVEELGKGKETLKESVDGTIDLNDERILWIGSAKNTGIRFNVRERKLRRDTPILIRNDEDLPVSYDIELYGTCLPREDTAVSLTHAQSYTSEHHTYYFSTRSHWHYETTRQDKQWFSDRLGST
jgi:hypothetical protein